MSSVSPGAILTPKRSWNKSSAKFEVTNKEHYGTLWYFLEWSIKITDKLVALFKAKNMQVYFTRLHLPYYQEIIISLTEVFTTKTKISRFQLNSLVSHFVDASSYCSSTFCCFLEKEIESFFSQIIHIAINRNILL